VHLRRPERARNEGSTGPNRLDDAQNRAERALYFSGNENLEKAIGWLDVSPLQPSVIHHFFFFLITLKPRVE